jgi:hypothetical protein
VDGGGSINFALHAKFAKAVTLVLFDEANNPLQEVHISNRSGKRGWAIAAGSASLAPHPCISAGNRINLPHRMA